MTETSRSVDIRAMVEADLGRGHDIHADCLRISLSKDYTPLQLEAWMAGRSPQGYWRAVSSGEIYLVAEDDGAVLGYASWKDGELLSLFVDPQCQRGGVGTRLIEACDQRTDITLVKATPSAVGFYERFGFHVVRRGWAEKREVRIPHVRMQRHGGWSHQIPGIQR